MAARRYPQRNPVARAFLGLVLFGAFPGACASPEKQPAPEARAEPGDRAERVSRVERELILPEAVPAREGIAVVFLVDVSSGMWTGILDRRSSNTVSSEIVIAEWAVLDLTRQLEQHAQARPDVPVLVGLFAFGGLRDARIREVIPLSAPNPARVEQMFPELAAENGKPIGDAMVTAVLALDRTGVTRRHLFVATGGGHTHGHDPADVVAALMRRPEADRPSVHFVTFDVAAPWFDALRNEGALVLDATNVKELNTTLDSILAGKVLIEGK